MQNVRSQNGQTLHEIDPLTHPIDGILRVMLPLTKWSGKSS